MMPIAPYQKGFTVIELLIGMLITSIVLSAVATFAFAMSVASAASDDTTLQQAQVRQATLRLKDLVGRCKLLCAAPGTDLVIWRADDNPGDNQINLNELVYLERGQDCNELRLCQFTAADNPHVTLSDLAQVATKAQLLAAYPATVTPLTAQAKDVAFAFYPAAPAVTGVKCLSVSFTLTGTGGAHRYECVTALHGRAAYLLTPAGDALVNTDDD